MFCHCWLDDLAGYGVSRRFAGVKVDVVVECHLAYSAVVALALNGRCRWKGAGSDGGEATGMGLARKENDAWMDAVRTGLNVANEIWVRGVDEPFAFADAFHKSLWNRGTSALCQQLEI